jgi:hypothetical protein
MSAPHVSGVASLMFSLNPTLTPNQVLSILENTATAFPSGSSCNTSNCGSGIVNAAAALLAVPDAMPGTPILSAIINPYGDSSYTVNWNDVPNADTYRLQEDDNISFSTQTTVSNILISSYDVSGKPAGTWYYRVQSINSDGASTWSNAVSTTVKPQPPVLDAINNPTNEDAYLISWSSQAGADGYILLEADNDFSGATTKYQGTDTSYLVTGQAGGNWYYKVRAYNGVVVGNLVYGDLSNIKTVTVKYSTLDAPNLLAISNPEQESSFTVSWIAVPTATSYILEESDTPYFVDPVVVYNGALTQALLEDREGGSLYYRVRAVSNTDQGPWSNSQFTEVQRVVYLPLVFKNLDNAPDFPTTFNSVADTCVLQGYPSENYGDYLDMLVGYDDSFDPDGEIARSFVMFDLSEIPNGTYISQAMLYLYLTGSYDFLNQSRTVTIYRAGSPWSEMKVTWYSQPAIQEAYGTASVTHGQWGWYAFNVKGLVSGWVNDTWPNYGLAIRGPEHSGYDSSWKSFFTRESDFAPYIEVSYSALAVRETQSLVANTVLDGPNFLESFSPQAETGKQLLFVNQSE